MPNLIRTEDKLGYFAEKQKKADKKFERKFFSPSASIKPWNLLQKENDVDIKQKKEKQPILTFKTFFGPNSVLIPIHLFFLFPPPKKAFHS